jgi:hypothetical protein
MPDDLLDLEDLEDLEDIVLERLDSVKYKLKTDQAFKKQYFEQTNIENNHNIPSVIEACL